MTHTLIPFLFRSGLQTCRKVAYDFLKIKTAAYAHLSGGYDEQGDSHEPSLLTASSNNTGEYHGRVKRKTTKKTTRRKYERTKCLGKSNDTLKDMKQAVSLDPKFLGPFVPFEGAVEVSSSNDGGAASSVTANDSFVVSRCDLQEGRFYNLSSPSCSYMFPSVTTILRRTAVESYPLLQWRQKLTVQHGKKGFDAIRQSTLKSGSNFHEELEKRLLEISSKNKKLSSEYYTMSSDESPIDEGISVHSDARSENELKLTDKEPSSLAEEALNTSRLQTTVPQPLYMQSIAHVLEDISQVKVLESSVAHFQLGYMGTFDCLAKYKGTLCLIDWKTSNKPKASLEDCYDYPLQAVAYAGAINHDPNFDFKVQNVLLVIVYPSGEPAHAHFLNHELCQKYWLKWVHRLQNYQTQFSEDLSEIIV